MKRILYLGWLGFNNLGDELMWDEFKSLSSRLLDSNEYEVIPSTPKVNIRDYESYDMFVLGGGSLIIPGYIDVLYNALTHGKEIMIWGSGHDWSDKSYLEKLQNNSKKEVTHMFNPEIDSKLKTVIDSAKYVGIRGPFTYEFLKYAKVNMDRVEISGDPGFLVIPKKLPDKALINKWNNKEKIIGINWGTSYNKIYGQNEKAVEDELVKSAKDLISQGYKIYIYTVWGPDRGPSKRLYKKINDTKNVIFDEEIHKRGELLSILKKCYATINFKLHANVLSAAADTPFICLGYRFKSFDFCASLSLLDLAISTDSANLSKEIEQKLNYIKSNESYIKKTLMQHRKSYKEKLKGPFIKKLF